jgi:hypothetical protein
MGRITYLTNLLEQLPDDSSLSPQEQTYLRDFKEQVHLQMDAERALEAGDYTLAAQYATELLDRNTDTRSWNYGNILYDANQILGLAALRSGDTDAAKAYLLAAGKTPGSPQLDSFGPDMTLAQELLHAGERDSVLEFLDRITLFWATPDPKQEGRFAALARRKANKITAWKEAIRDGGVPNLDRFDVR